MNHHDAYSAVAQSLEEGWRKLCESFLPVFHEGSIWRFSRESLEDDPEQGWKLHLSATVLNANRLLQAVGPFLERRRVLFKAPASLDVMNTLNSGIYYGYTQIGKCVTIYPGTPDEARVLATKLHQLTRQISAPSVPFDQRYRPESCVFYRYGAFKSLAVEGSGGEHRYAIRDPDGNLVPDQRQSASCPPWAVDPFQIIEAAEPRPDESPLKTRFKAFSALAQRGKGGVYQALDVAATPPRVCILKEGRRDGEVGWDGRDGATRVQNEELALRSLQEACVNVPRLYSSFKAERNYYIALEFIEGENLERWLSRRHRRLSIPAAMKWSMEIAQLVSTVHRAGWVWRDCKPRNLILDSKGELRPIDFEGACPIAEPDPLPWGTSTYTPPEIDAEFHGQSRLPEDLYALGVTIYIMFAGCPPDASAPLPLEECRQNVPAELAKVVAELLNPDPQKRPGADVVVARLGMLLASPTSRPLHSQVNSSR